MTWASGGTSRTAISDGACPPATTTTTSFVTRAFLRWHYPDQVHRVGGALYRPLSPVARAPLTLDPIVTAEAFVAELADVRIGRTFNQYALGERAPELRRRLVEYLEARTTAPLLLVGEAAGYRGARVSGLPFTSERQLTGTGPAEATATIVHRVLAELGLEEQVLLWNVVPTHPGTAGSNRRPTCAEVAAASPFLTELARGRRGVAVGRLAETRLGQPSVRHPAHGGAKAFRTGMVELLDRGHLLSDPP